MSKLWPDAVPAFAVERATAIGFSSQILFSSGLPPSLGWILPVHIIPALALGQIAFSFDAQNMPEAVIAWAYLDDATARQLESNPWRPLHTSEWNEGTNLWITALLARPGRGGPLLRGILRGRLAGFDRARGYQRRPDGSVKRLLDWSRPKAPSAPGPAPGASVDIA